MSDRRGLFFCGILSKSVVSVSLIFVRFQRNGVDKLSPVGLLGINILVIVAEYINQIMRAIDRTQDSLLNAVLGSKIEPEVTEIALS